MKKKILMLLLGVSSQTLSHGQALLPTDYHSVSNVKSPTAASLSKYGDIPVDLFTGTPQISIPLTSIEYGGIKVPVNLSYNASGIRVSERPGWAGLGWSVIAGGQISRKTNWFADEWYNRHPNIQPGDIDQGFYFLGNRLNTANWNTAATVKDYCGVDLTYADKQAKHLPDGEPDEFVFNFGEYSGSFYLSETGQWQVKSKQDIKLEVQSEIDYSANYKLYKDFDDYGNPGVNTSYNEEVSSLFTKFTIITPDGYKYEFGGTPAAIEFSRGSIHTSGQAGHNMGAYEDRRNNITANAWNLTKITTPAGESIVLHYERGMVQFNTGRYFSLYYSLVPTNNQNAVSDPNGGDQLSFSVSAVNPSYLTSIESPAKKIEFIRSQATELSSEPTPIFESGSYTVAGFKDAIARNWVDLIYASGDPNYQIIPNYNQRLDEIKVYDKIREEYINKIVLGQTNNANKRRTLDNVSFYDFNGHSAGTYRLAYSNVENLPFYESLRRDHWGYFNGGTEPSGPAGWPTRTENGMYSSYGLLNSITYPTGGTTTFQFEPNYYSSILHIDPNAASPISLLSAQGSAGVRIKSVTSQANFSSPALTTDFFYAANYANGGTTSSGILSSEPRYTDFIKFTNPGGMGNLGASCEGDFELTNRTDDNSEWMSQARGGLVTYSEVTTKNPDGSYIVTKYTNNDNAAYRDEMGSYYSFGGNTTFQTNYRLTSNDLERGKILSEESYKSSGTKVADKIYTYRNDPNRKNQFIKAYAKKILLASIQNCEGYGLGGGIRAWTYKVYYYKNPLKQIESNVYETNGTVSNTKTFSYDDYGNIITTTDVASDGKKIIQNTKYNSDPAFLQYNAVTNNAINIRKLFYQYKIKNLPIETITSILPAGNQYPLGADRITAGTLLMFTQPLTIPDKIYKMELSAPFYPVTYSGSGMNVTPVYHFTPSAINSNGEFVADERYKLQSSINTFTTNATASPGVLNATSLLRPLNLSAINSYFAYTWDYDMQHLTSQTQNTPLNNLVSGSPEFQTAFTSFEGYYLDMSQFDDNRGNWNFDKNLITDGGVTGKKYISLHTGASNDELVSTFVLKQYKKYMLSFWAKGSFPRLLNGTTSFSTAAYLPNNEWKYYEFEVTGNNQPIIIKVANQGGGSGQLGYITDLDEVRLYPSDARMQSYTYNSLGNVTSIDDGAGKITFYQYDLFGRLVIVKDQDGNILQNTGYTVQGPQ